MPPQTPPHQTVPWALRTRAQRPSWTGPCSLFLLDSRRLSGPSAHVLPTPRRGTHLPLSCAVSPTPALPSSPPQSVFFLPASPGWSLCFVFAPPPQDMCEALWHPCSNGCHNGVSQTSLLYRWFSWRPPLSISHLQAPCPAASPLWNAMSLDRSFCLRGWGLHVCFEGEGPDHPLSSTLGSHPNSETTGKKSCFSYYKSHFH